MERLANQPLLSGRKALLNSSNFSTSTPACAGNIFNSPTRGLHPLSGFLNPPPDSLAGDLIYTASSLCQAHLRFSHRFLILNRTPQQATGF
jgi:hypothetical protein